MAKKEEVKPEVAPAAPAAPSEPPAPAIENKRDNYPAAVFVDANGKEWAAKVIPLPLNKATIVRLPDMEGAQREAARILTLPFEQQAKAFAEFSGKAKEKIYLSMQHSGERAEIVEVDGKLQFVTEHRGRRVPCRDLLINYSEKAEIPNWSFKARVVLDGYISKAGAGQRQTPYFRFK